METLTEMLRLLPELQGLVAVRLSAALLFSNQVNNIWDTFTQKNILFYAVETLTEMLRLLPELQGLVAVRFTAALLCSNQVKNVWDTVTQKIMYISMMKIIDFRGDLIDISAETATLLADVCVSAKAPIASPSNMFVYTFIKTVFIRLRYPENSAFDFEDKLTDAFLQSCRVAVTADVSVRSPR